MEIDKCSSIFEKITNSKSIHEATLLIENGDGSLCYSANYGDKTLDSPILIASITKMITSACVFILEEKNKLSFTDRVVDYFKSDTLKGLHMLKGKDYTSELTIMHLLTQTSGLPDVYEETKSNIKKKMILQDFEYSMEEWITITKTLKPHFTPRLSGKAYYADINFDILGEIVEKVTNSSLSQVFNDYIFKPLGLTNTYVPNTSKDIVPYIYYKNRKLYRPGSIASSAASGGVISTTNELMVFLKAFFQGALFNTNKFNNFSTHRKLQLSRTPIHYGIGYMHIPLGGMSTVFQGKGQLIGHSGSTGSYAFYYPEKDLFFVGDLNQMTKPTYPVRLAMQLAIAMK